MPICAASARRCGRRKKTAFAEKLRTTLAGDNLPPVSSAHEIQKYRVNGQKYSSTDSGDVSWVTPVATLNTATRVPGTPAHSWQATATGGMGIGIKAAVVAAKTLALTAAQLYQSPETIAATKAEFEKSRGPNFVYKSLAGAGKPPLDYRKTSNGVAAADAAPG
jgi:aminobenzoyl-glutamate utilization protein B